MVLDALLAVPKRLVLPVVYWLIAFFERVVVPHVIMPVVERNVLPDALVRFGIRLLLRGKLNDERSPTTEQAVARKQSFIGELKALPIAIHTADANRQHYEIPAAYYSVVLGPWKKYSSCLWPAGCNGLKEAEEAMLTLVCERARVRDGQRILDLGCGWASCALWLATQYPNAQVVGVSNSQSQRLHNEREAAERGLRNVKFITADITTFAPDAVADGFLFDRIITNEMFEHMKNYQQLLARVSSWLKPQGLLFVHIFTHRQYAYHFRDGWMADTFFTGGTMPSDDLLLHFQDDVVLQQKWVVNGQHYAKTLDAWLARHDAHESAVRKVLAQTYGAGQDLKWFVYWRLFYMACSECFGYNRGNEWGVSHYLFSKRALGGAAPLAAAAASAGAAAAAGAGASPVKGKGKGKGHSEHKS